MSLMDVLRSVPIWLWLTMDALVAIGWGIYLARKP